MRSVSDPKPRGRQLPDRDFSEGVHPGLRRARSESVDELVDVARWSGYVHLNASVGQVPYRPPEA